MSKRKVDGSERMSIDDSKEDVSMVKATAGTTDTSSEGGQHQHDFSSLFDVDAIDASQRQSYVTMLGEAYERANSATENWGNISRTVKIGRMVMMLGDVLRESGITGADRDRYWERVAPFFEIREKSDLVDHGPRIGQSAAASAFGLGYTGHADDSAFLNHLEQQREIYLERKKRGTESCAGGNAPFFAVIQSSGYGKSRLISQISACRDQQYDVIYWTFASKQAYPPKNVEISELQFNSLRREALEKALHREISVAVGNAQSGRQADSETIFIQLGTNTKPPQMQQRTDQKRIIFVVDEASELLGKFTSDGVSFYRALRTAFTKFETEASWLFFVVMSTFSSITYLSPELAMDPSFKPYSGYDDVNQNPLNPFILGSSFRVNNDRHAILTKTVEECHDPQCLYSMGRPLWKALLTGTTPMLPHKLLSYGRKKLRNSLDNDIKLTKKEEILAVLSVRLCLSISPTSWYVPSLVACHMGTALSISEDRMSMVVTYPSEPVLAVGAKMFMKNQENIGRMISALQDFLTHGAVDRGYKGELIVRLLMTLAMDKAMGSEEVKEVQLKDYLVQFDRDDADLGELINGLNNNGYKQFDVEEELKKLKRLNLDWPDSRAILEDKKRNLPAQAPPPLTYADGSVCFTHFVYLSKSTQGELITHDLLRYAYRRSAAIVVEEGPRGIDKVIPLRVEEDKFVGLVVQHKNRASDTLQSLTRADNPATHHKVNVEYFLTEAEKETFRSAGVDLERNWPAILFAVGVDKVGAEVATQLEQKRFRHNNLSNTDRFDFPCIILTGLDYSKLMTADAAARLKDLRDFEFVPSLQKREDIPITYGS
mmetsp:Transcript_9988/g.21826  ORF Transcript_9988/g.21826 Transcript_9988/m.21826 type:complete len:829 (+) Transcript_9988:186-2672(+)|eukprot:CAMPEP_0168806842 /NCGR_PEP_ID=MMETSP0726-20121227/1750_1 /TAXON_ID=265536 /ORGANISM="Amphiprora sp., Strain CCMP467" /LENGTH=828 /DNA_ID=CAMNT_0008858751 /DNA_START=142 /DNA_END=2628 /DNA_ORIENTATION=+